MNDHGNSASNINKSMSEKPKARFQQDFNEISEPIELQLGISIDNPKSEGENLEAFCNLVCKKRDKIKKVVIIDTSYLNRHYSFKYSNKAQKTEWLKKNERYLGILKANNIDFEVRDWSKIVANSEYANMKQRVMLDYTGDSNQGIEPDQEFRQIVDKIIKDKEEKTKCKTADILKYLIEESAGTAILQDDLFYPGKFNQAIEYVVKKYNPKLHLRQYRVDAFVPMSAKTKFTLNAQTSTNTSTENSQNSKCARTVDFLAQQFNISPENIDGFHQEIYSICRKYQQQQSIKADINQEPDTAAFYVSSVVNTTIRV